MKDIMLNIRFLGLQPYQLIFNKMQQFTKERTTDTVDELWLLEHFPVYTQGQAGKKEHILRNNNIPIIQSDRGGQITYHGPGQLVGYILIDIRRKHLGIRTLVNQLELVIIEVLNSFNITAHSSCDAPGVYVGGQKIASIGLRVKNGCTYHGIAINVSMNLQPFLDINPCGFVKLQMTQIQFFKQDIDINEVRQKFVSIFLNNFGYQISYAPIQ